VRRWLSNSHLYSSAFVVDTERDRDGVPTRFTLRGAGWGHGVGLCQIGAAVMAARGKKAEEIVLHYFRGARVQRLY
jgi:SpoIID/LytB domain protein